MIRGGLRRTLLVCVIAVAGASPASADWQFAPFIGLNFLGNTTLVDLEAATGDVHRSYGGTVVFIGKGPLGAEAYVSYTPGFFDQGDLTDVTRSRAVAAMGNVVLAAPLSWNEYGLRPFVSGGVGLLHASMTDFREIFKFTKNVGAYNIGGGAVGFLTDRTGLRFDLRYIGTLPNRDDSTAAFGAVHLRYWTGSVGVVFKY